MKTQAEILTDVPLLDKLYYPSREELGKAPSSVRSPEAPIVNHQVLQILQRNLHAIIGHCEIAVAQKAAAWPTEIQDSAEQALNLVQMLRQYQESQATGEVLNRGRCRPALFLDLLESLVEPEARRRGVTFDLFREKIFPDTLFTHQRGLRTALLQLLDDALQDADTVAAVKLSVGQLHVGQRHFLVFTITRCGSGASQATSPSSEPARPNRDFLDRESGWGLRLAIAAGWASQLGGLLEGPLQSSEKSCYHLIVPVDEAIPRTLDQHTASQLILQANKRAKETTQ